MAQLMSYEQMVESAVMIDATKCPNPECKSDDIDKSSAKIDGNFSYQNCWCWKCHTTWVDKYQLVDQTDILIPARFLKRA